MIEVKLTHNEVFEAVFEYVKEKYPELLATQATIAGNRGHFSAKVKCEYRGTKSKENPFKPRTEGEL